MDAEQQQHAPQSRECALCFEDLPLAATVALNTLTHGCDCNMIICYRCILMQLKAPVNKEDGHVGFRCPSCRFSYSYVLNVDKTLVKMRNNPFRAVLPELCSARTSTLFTSPTTTLLQPASFPPDKLGEPTTRLLESFFYDEFDALESPLGADVPMQYYTLFVQMVFFEGRANADDEITCAFIEHMLPPEHFFNDETTRMERKRALDVFCAHMQKEETQKDMLGFATARFCNARITAMAVDPTTMIFESPWTSADGDRMIFDNEFQRMCVRTAIERAVRDDTPHMAMRAFLCHMPYCVYTFFLMVALSVPREEFTLRTVLGFAMRSDVFRVDQLKYLSEFTARYQRVYLPVQYLWIDAFLRFHTDFDSEMQLDALNAYIVMESKLTPAQCTLGAYFRYYDEHPEIVDLVCGTRVFNEHVTMATQHARFMRQFAGLSEHWHTDAQRAALESYIDAAGQYAISVTTNGTLRVLRIRCPMQEIALHNAHFSSITPFLRIPVMCGIACAIAAERM